MATIVTLWSKRLMSTMYTDMSLPLVAFFEFDSGAEATRHHLV